MAQHLTVVQAPVLQGPSLYEARVWLVAESLYHGDHPGTGRLIYVDHTVRGPYLQQALKVVSLLDDGATAHGERNLIQAFADFTVHRQAAMERNTLRCWHVTGVSDIEEGD